MPNHAPSAHSPTASAEYAPDEPTTAPMDGPDATLASPPGPFSPSPSAAALSADSRPDSPAHIGLGVNTGVAEFDDELNRGIWSVLEPALMDLELGVSEVKTSQENLGAFMDQLEHDLGAINRMVEPPPRLRSSLGQLSASKQRLTKVNQTLVDIQRRLDQLAKFAKP
ncbi:hypothetical protein H4R34_002821 [Dimargaris verticillata]|uniref:Biogenesis of lysosome-related organelles complex 1 subunit 7 n=1 Tax=Dimargaris verticillata TaxID=2761393 RepID=A0A9W8B223_9FUNG|nr:hypothetical protein H4R34_002821 [Dimargaris verticillata]